MTYDFRRLRLHGVVERIPKSHRYRVTDLGWSVALFFARSYNRLLRTGLADIADSRAAGPLRQAITNLDAEFQRLAERAGLAAA